jgi:hypothetical protein
MFMKLLNPKYSIAILTILLFTLFTFTLKAQTIKTVAGNGSPLVHAKLATIFAAGALPLACAFATIKSH